MKRIYESPTFELHKIIICEDILNASKNSEVPEDDKKGGHDIFEPTDGSDYDPFA